jgi:hypothetical protein
MSALGVGVSSASPSEEVLKNIGRYGTRRAAGCAAAEESAARSGFSLHYNPRERPSRQVREQKVNPVHAFSPRDGGSGLLAAGLDAAVRRVHQTGRRRTARPVPPGRVRHAGRRGGLKPAGERRGRRPGRPASGAPTRVPAVE